MDVNVWDCYPQVSGKRFYLINGKYVRDNDLIGEKSICLDEAIDTMNALYEKNEQLKSELQGMEELLKSYRKTIKHDAELLADATKNGYLPPLEDWKGDVE